jgi:hypothetical protein
LFLEHGRIVEEGTHLELLHKGGRYASLFCQQSTNQHRTPTEPSHHATSQKILPTPSSSNGLSDLREVALGEWDSRSL